MISRIFTLIDTTNSRVVIAISATVLIVVAALDYLSGDGLASSVFYLIPVAVAGWRFEFRISGAFALSATMLSILVLMLLNVEYSNTFFAIWDGVSRFIVYFSFAVLLAHVRTSLEQARELALTDHLTGVANSRYFHEEAERELEHCRRHERPFTLAYIDIDDFKDVNDAIGHSGGDRVIKAVAGSLAGSVRRVDQVARQGGDEFMLFLHEVDPRQAERVLQQIHERVMLSLQQDGHDVSLSVGGVTWRFPPPTLDAAIHAADRVMYEVKRTEKGSVLHRTIGNLVDDPQLDASEGATSARPPFPGAGRV